MVKHSVSAVRARRQFSSGIKCFVGWCLPETPFPRAEQSLWGSGGQLLLDQPDLQQSPLNVWGKSWECLYLGFNKDTVSLSILLEKLAAHGLDGAVCGVKTCLTSREWWWLELHPAGAATSGASQGTTLTFPHLYWWSWQGDWGHSLQVHRQHWTGQECGSAEGRRALQGELDRLDQRAGCVRFIWWSWEWGTVGGRKGTIFIQLWLLFFWPSSLINPRFAGLYS